MLSIIIENTIGLLNDALLCKYIFEKNNVKTIIINQKVDKINTDNVLFIEKIVEIKANKKLFLPNHELFKNNKQCEMLKDIDIILCKTKISYTYFENIKKDNNFMYSIIYTKFSTFIPKEMKIKSRDIVKDKNLYILFAGSSQFKNVAYVVKNWIDNNYYRHLNENIRLIITCWGRCFNYMIDDFKNYLKYDCDVFNNKENKLQIGNITFYKEMIPFEEYNKLLCIASTAICVSSKEGFGHYINEARYRNTFVITINHPPMNELINKNNGYLIDSFEKIDQNISFTEFKLYTVYPDTNELTKAIEYSYGKKVETRKDFKEDLKYMKNIYEKEVIKILKI
jgi:hypothetical protein